MTAEIAILNKTAIALAADSAVTISAADREQKIFDSGDKLFELSNKNPIGIMIYGDLSFVQTPLPSLIRAFRAECTAVEKVEHAADSFLAYLERFGRQAPKQVSEQELVRHVRPQFLKISSRHNSEIQKKISDPEFNFSNFREHFEAILTTTIDIFIRILKNQNDASFVGVESSASISVESQAIIASLISEIFPVATTEQVERLTQIALLVCKKDVTASPYTGIVVAGFGDKDLFPTLISFDVFGVISGQLKYVRRNFVDIDRVGTCAKVLPFAQHEMVERFLYGMDSSIERQISVFCKSTLPEIADGLFDNIEFDDPAGETALREQVGDAVDRFLNRLQETALASIRSDSQAEIEDMVEFMPKPELARMAEALVNLTSIKRKVSRGMETVGGPIDVAVISQSEGFVWIKRKHYFPAELNSRYISRMQATLTNNQGDDDGSADTVRPPRRRGRKAQTGQS